MKELEQEEQTLIEGKIKSFLSKLGEDHGLVIEYFPIQFRRGTQTELDKIEWNTYCEKFGLKKNMFGKKFKVGNELSEGTEYQIVKIKKWTEKAPVLVQKIEDSTVQLCMSVKDVLKALGK